MNSIKFYNRFRSAEFILKITVPKVAEKVAEKLTEKVAEKVTEKVTKDSRKLTEKLTENGNVTENVTENYRLDKGGSLISTSKMAEIIGVDRRNIARNIKKLQDQGVVRRVGPDKGGFWEIIV